MEVRPVTEGRGLDAAGSLFDSEERFRLLVESVSDYAIFMLDRDGYVVSWNAGAERIKGYKASEIIGQHFSKFYSPEDKDKPAYELKRAIEEGRVDDEGWRLRKDGSRFWAHVVITALYDDKGELRGFGKVTRDVKRSEEILSASNRRVSDLLGTAGDGFFALDSDWNFTYVSRTASEMTGHSQEELVLHNIWETIPEFKGTEVEVKFRKSVTEQKPLHFEYRNPATRLLFQVGAYPAAEGLSVVMRNVTEQRRTAGELWRSQQNLADFVENATIGLHWVGPDGRILWANKAELDMLGYTADEYLGRPIADFHVDREVIDNILTRLAAGEQIRQYEARLRCKDGSIKIGSINSNVLWRDNEFIHTRCFTTDITQRKQAEEALRISEERFRVALSNGLVVTYQQDLEFRYKWIFPHNPEFSDQVIGKTDHDLIPLDEAEVLAEIKKRVIATKKEERHEIKASVPGGVRYYDLMVEPLCDDSGEVTGVGGTAFDITDRIVAEEALKDSEQRLRLALEAGHMGTWEWKLSAAEVSWSPGLAEIHGLPADSSTGSLDDFLANVHPDDLDYVMNSITQAVEMNTELLVEYRISKTEGKSRWVLSRGKVYLDESGKRQRFAGVCLEITERKALEEQLLQSQKMEAIGKLAGGVAHDFNNLLTAILGYAEISATMLPEGEIVRGHIEQIQKAGRRAAELTGQLLAFARKQLIEPKLIDLNELITGTTNMLQRLLGEDIELRTELAADLGTVKVDPAQFEQILVNLAVNSRDAMPSGGGLTIATANISVAPDANPEASAGDYVRMQVIDEGIGMTGETRNKMFEPFFTTKEKGKGSGLGLATSYGIVKQSGGHIWAESEPDMGTTVTVILPRDYSSEPSPFSGGQEVQHEGGHETVLIVEDEPLLLQIAADTLKAQGYVVLTAQSGQEAIELAKTHDGKIDLILADVVMPQISGKDVVDVIRKRRPETKTLYISGYAHDSIVQHGVLESGTPFLAKPFSPAQLSAKVREVIRCV